MFSKFKKNYEKQVMGYLSYIPDFKNLENLREEMELYRDSNNNYEVLIFKGKDGDCRGIVGTQEDDKFIVIRYISLDPGFRNAKTESKVIHDLEKMYPHKLICALPDYTYLLKYVKQDDVNDTK